MGSETGPDMLDPGGGGEDVGIEDEAGPPPTCVVDGDVDANEDTSGEEKLAEDNCVVLGEDDMPVEDTADGE